MRRYRAIFALGAFILPIAFRSLWFYQGIYRVQEPISTPDYGSIELPIPPIGSQPFVPTELSSEGKTILFDLAHSNQFNIGELEEFIAGLIAELVSNSFRARSGEMSPPLPSASNMLMLMS